MSGVTGKWMKPGRGQFAIWYRRGERREPDFVIETLTEKLISGFKAAASVNVVENADGFEVATAQAGLGGSCRVSLVGGGLSISPMASTPI